MQISWYRIPAFVAAVLFQLANAADIEFNIVAGADLAPDRDDPHLSTNAVASDFTRTPGDPSSSIEFGNRQNANTVVADVAAGRRV